MGPGFLSSGSPGPKRGVRKDISAPPCGTCSPRKGTQDQKKDKELRHSPRESGKSAEQTVFKPRPRRNAVQQPGIQSQGPVVGATESKFPRKAAVKAEHSSQLLDDVKGGVDCGVEAGVRAGRGSRQGRESERHLEPGLGCHYPSWEVGATQML